MWKFAPVAAILLVLVLSSGCTVPVLNIEIPGLEIPGFGATVVQDTSDILVIKSMEAIPDTIDSGQTSKIIAYIQNTGDKAIGDGTTENGVTIDLYDYCQGLLTPTLLTCGTEVASTQGTTKCTIGTIRPKETVPVIWNVCQNKATPVKVKTVCPSDGLKMYVRYPYTTVSLTTIKFIGLSEMQRQMIERRYDTDNGYISLGQGPIKPVMTVEDKQPIPVYDILPGTTNTNSDVVNARTVLKLQLQNKGSGQLDTKVPVTTSDGRTRDVIGIKWDSIKVTGIGTGDNDLKVGTKENVADDSELPCPFMDDTWKRNPINNPVRFVGDESSPYYCIIDASALKGKVTLETSRTIGVEVAYDYLLTKSTMLTIDPKTEA